MPQLDMAGNRALKRGMTGENMNGADDDEIIAAKRDEEQFS